MEWVENDVEVLKKELAEMTVNIEEQLEEGSKSGDPNVGNLGTTSENSLGVLEKIGVYLKRALTEINASTGRAKSPCKDDNNALSSNSHNDYSCDGGIRSHTDVKEQETLLREFKGLKLIDDISDAQQTKFNNHLRDQSITCYFTLKIENHLDVKLDQLDFYIVDSLLLDFKPEVISGESTLLTVTDPSNKHWTKGNVSYRIAGENTRLVIEFDQTEGYVQVAFAPECTPMAESVFPFDEDHGDVWKCMTNKRWIECGKTDRRIFVVRHHGILARISVTGTKSIKGISVALTRKAVTMPTESELNLERPISTVSLSDGRMVREKSDQGFRINCSVLNYGYVLEISNYLNVSLNDPQVYLENGESPDFQPDLVTALGREVFIAETEFCGDENGGVVTYRIDTTDLRLAIAFQLFNNGNAFAIGFVPEFIEADDLLLAFLTNRNIWKTCMDHKYAGAKDGDQVIETRNIQACASMTEGPKALIKVAIKTV